SMSSLNSLSPASFILSFPSIAPVIKVCANSKTSQKMQDNIDIDVSTVIDGKESIKEAGERLFKELIEVLNGKKTKTEILKHHEFAIYLTQPTL
ncbi:MAG: hypothetical protein WHT65_03960, partial [Pseudothermotoga sp.]